MLGDRAGIELFVLGEMTLVCSATGRTETGLRAQVKAALAIVVLEGDARFGIDVERLTTYLWTEEVTEGLDLAARLDRLLHEIKGVFAKLDPDGRYVERSAGFVRLRGITVDARRFDVAYSADEYARAIELGERGRVLEGIRLRRTQYALREWLDERARPRYAVRLDRCYSQYARQLTKSDASVEAIIDIVSRRERAAEFSGLRAQRLEASGDLERLYALSGAGREPLAPIPRHAGATTRVPAEQPLDRLLASRLGSALSLYVDPGHVDASHRYDYVFRQDLLDYPSGDYYSIRRLKGRNVTDRPSTGMLYVECSEQKITFDDTGSRAYDTETRARLVVESLLPRHERLFRHAFRILFPRPMSPGEQFDVTFAIRVPGELKVLSPIEEIMSIALVRLVHGVGRLDFNVCLNFEPLAVAGECLGDDGHPVSAIPSPAVAPYVPKAWYERDLDITWSAQPHIVSWRVDEPEAPMYIIRYRV